MASMDDYKLTVAETVKLARTIESVEMTGLQVAIIANCLAATIQNHDLLPQSLKDSVGYLSECEKTYEYMTALAESILNSYTEEETGENNAKTS